MRPQTGRMAIATAPLTRARRRPGVATTSFMLALYLLAVGNVALWRALFAAVDEAHGGIGLLALLGLVAFSVLWALLAWVAWGRMAKPVWIACLALAATAAYFMDGYGVVIDRIALLSVVETNVGEAGQWASARIPLYLLLAVLPAAWLLRRPLVHGPIALELGKRVAIAAVAAATIALALVSAFQPLAGIARNHRELPLLFNPVNLVLAGHGLVRDHFASRGPKAPVGVDARVVAPAESGGQRRTLVLAIGESARASSFSLLGYARETNPQLARRGVISIGAITACGTSTAIALPCMFSDLGLPDGAGGAARRRESLLDVVRHAGLSSLWIDNNTGSKGIAAATIEVDLYAAHDPAGCGPKGCFDAALVDQLVHALDAPEPPSLIVLHMLGSHGPSYFERYPPEFRRFGPTCDSADLGACDMAAIRNTYDNSILYTDHVLARMIDQLDARRARLDSALVFVSDHGESTGEHGLFLHGAPGFLAPPEQTRVPLLMWLSDGFVRRQAVDTRCLATLPGDSLDQSILFHTALGALSIDTSARDPALDLFARCARSGLAAGGGDAGRRVGAP